VTTNIQGQEL